jgi:choloylglycine hydrolase
MCTNLLLAVPAEPNTFSSPELYVSARCLELAGHLATNLYLVPRGQSFPLFDPQFPAANRARWTNPYGFVGIGPSPADFSKIPCFMDGLNEKGLSVGALWLPGTTYPLSGEHPTVFFTDFASWILGQFERVRDLEHALANISVVGPEPTWPGYFPLHFIATDAGGASLVVEFVGGEMKVYPPSYLNGATSDGVLTNAPTYDWQRANLANYAHLSLKGPATSVKPSNAPPVGSGLLGMPGDPMSSSRFVRAATLRKGLSLLPKDGNGWMPAPGDTGPEQTIVNVAMQLVQIVMATPYGMLLEDGTLESPAPKVGDWTMWSVVRNHTMRKLYFSTAFNGIMRVIDLNALRFDEMPARAASSFQTIPLMPSPFKWCEDATALFG